MYRQSGFLKKNKRKSCSFLCVWKGKTTTVLNKIGLEKEAKGVWECKNILFLTLMAH